MKLGELCIKVGSGATPRGGKEVYQSEGVAFIRSQNVYNGGFSFAGLARISDKAATQLAGVSVEDQDVLLNITGESVGRCCLAPQSALPARVSQHVMIVRPDGSRLHAPFLRYWFTSPRVASVLTALSAAGATRRALTKGMIEGLETSFPDLPEQRRIAAVLGALDDKIELNRKMNRTLEEVAQAIFKSWFIDFDGVRPEDLMDSVIGPIPRGWGTQRADRVAEVAIGKTPPRKEHEWFSKPPIGVPWISIKDMGSCGAYVRDTSECLSEEAVAKFRVRRIPDNTPILSFKLTVGRVAITDGEMLSNEAIAHFKLSDDAPVTPEYLYCYLGTFPYEILGSTSSIATAINSKIVKAMPILVPHRRMVGHFQETVGPVFARMKMLAHESRTLGELRDSLLPKLISGELRVPDAKETLGATA